ncbi:protein kinase [Achlya hypogyna]|uniref:Protein kinase n=1 Tax=Achlya hypogyna TaxID=1202772 RepID=A0A1V9YDX9_ACHHY|nr:protein kinase [Achlya hypogyna]
MQRLALFAALVLPSIAIAACEYASYGEGFRVFTSDSRFCGSKGYSCVVDATTCAILANVTQEDGAFVSPYYIGKDVRQLPYFNAIGDLASSSANMPWLLLANIGHIDLNLTSSFPLTLKTICHIDAFPPNFEWPNLLNLTLDGNALQAIPSGLPTSLEYLNITGNGISDLNGLPPHLKELYAPNNSLASVTNYNWTSITELAMSNNPLTTFANVQLSKNIQYFSCRHCKLTNFTVNQATYEALDQLPNFNDTNSTGFRMTTGINVDKAACASVNGTLRALWAGKSKLSFVVCVTPNPLPPTVDSAVSDNATASTGLVVGCVVGAVAVLGVIIFVVFRYKKRSAQDTTFYYTNHTDYQADTGLNVDDLRSHKLDNADLKVVSKKPLASGAFGEVWLGTYCGEKVAVKRIKDRRIESVKKFIDEIKLMITMDSEFVVKFVGVSWRRPIEMEVVVEYMDLGDLRNFLMTRTSATYNWTDKFTTIMRIVRGLVYLHTFEPPIIHRDLKSRNVLLDSQKGTKLTDFGTSREAADAGMTNGIGTYQWMAPEIIMGTEYTIAADVYSFGVILSEMSTHDVPYGDIKNPTTGRSYTQQAIMSKVASGELRPTFEQYETPAWVRDLGMQCLAQDPSDRPTSLMLTTILLRVKAEYMATN